MIGFAYLIGVIAFGYLAYRAFFWLPEKLSNTRMCPNCDGKGHWYGLRHREECKVCKGTGRIPKS